MAEEIKISVDGQEIPAQPGQMVIQAAMEAGLYIPYLCYYPGMKPFGACRMCVVTAEAPGPGRQLQGAARVSGLMHHPCLARNARDHQQL